MRSYTEIEQGARDVQAFSNHTEWEVWSANWCERCINDSQELVDKDGGCPLIAVGLLGKTPTEWFEHDRGNLTDRYHCVEFRDQDDGPGPDPQPIPDPPGQLTLLPRDPYEGTRMYAGVASAVVGSTS